MTKISQLSSIGDSLAIGDQFLIRDIDDAGSPNKSVTVSGITRALDLGTAAAPAIAFASDKNTGIYSPGADQVAISTNGTGRLFVGNGGVRLNTDTADSVSIFTVNGSSDSTFGIGVNNIYTATSNTFFAYRHLQNGTLLGGLFWQNSTSSLIRYSALNGIAFHTGSGVEGEERLRLDSSGRLGLGTSSPQLKLDVATLGTYGVIYQPAVNLRNTSSGGTAASPTGLGAINWNVDGLYDVANIEAVRENPSSGTFSSLVFRTNPTNVSTGAGTERMRIDSSGRVGIGTTNAAAYGMRLAVIENIGLIPATQDTIGTSAVAIKTQLGAAGGEELIRSEITSFANSSNYGTATIFSTRGGASVSERLRIDSSGNVGIGTTSPTKQLEVSTSSGAAISIRSSIAGSIASPKEMRLSFTGVSNDGSTPLEKAFIYAVDQQLDTGNTFMSLGTASTRAITIDSSQRVGIGTTSPGKTLEVAAPNVIGNYAAIRINSPYYTPWDITNNSDLVFTRNVTEAFRCDSSGRLLVGTSTARTMSTIGAPALFEVESSTNASLSATRTANDAFASTLVLAKVRGAAIVSNNDEVGLLSFEGHDGTAHIRAAAITAQIDGTPGTNDMPGRLVFSTAADGASSPTERMRIDSSGDVQIGTTTALARLTIEKAFAGGTAIDTNTTTASTTYSAAAFRHNGTLSGSIAVSTTATSYATSSDYRLKENVTAVTDGITRLQQLNPSRFNFIADPDRTVDGFIAHEVQDIVPEAITGEKDAEDDDGNPVYQGIDQSKMVPLVVAALQECIRKVEALESELALLKSKP